MAVDLTTGSYDSDGIFSKHNETENEKGERKRLKDFSLKGFQTKRILKECPRSKIIAVEGKFDGNETPSIVVVEKMPFDSSALSHIFSADSKLELKFQNNIYSNYHIFPVNCFNGIEVKVIHNATEEDFSKFNIIPLIMVKETPEMYKSVVIPHFTSQQSSMKCVEDVVCEAKVKEKIILTDTDPVAGFTLIDETMAKEPKDDKCFRAIALCQNQELKSLRDLRSEHLPLLLNIQEKGLKELTNRLKTVPCKIETYVHYPPSQFPFHVCFQSIEKDFSIPTEKAHQLTTIISNLQLIPDYYQQVDLTYSLPEADPLTVKLSQTVSLKV